MVQSASVAPEQVSGSPPLSLYEFAPIVIEIIQPFDMNIPQSRQLLLNVSCIYMYLYSRRM